MIRQKLSLLAVAGAAHVLLKHTPFGWRIMVALVGIASVLIVGRIARRLTRSNVIGTVTALLLALDGLHIAMSRTALLDIFMTVFVVGASWVILHKKPRRNVFIALPFTLAGIAINRGGLDQLLQVLPA